MKTNKIFLLVVLLATAIAVEAADVVNFSFYGSDLQVRFNAARRVKVKSCSGGELVRCLDWLNEATEDAIEDCLRIKKEMNLSDWAYLQLLDKMTTAGLGKTNEAVLMMAWMMDSSGYDVAICRVPARTLRILFMSDVELPGLASYQFYDKVYYLYNSTTKSQVKGFDPLSSAGNPIAFKKLAGQRLAFSPSEARTVTSKKNQDLSVSYTVNKNVIDFYASVPQLKITEGVGEFLASKANAPLDIMLKESLVTDLKRKVSGMKQKDALQQLLWWVQTGFDFAYDEDVWGYDRPFYAEETLFYPSCDTEDRSILLSRLVRDVLDLDVVLVTYGDQTAVGVCITDDSVPGEYVVYQGMHYVVCNPAHTPSAIGAALPAMAGKEKTVRLLQK